MKKFNSIAITAASLLLANTGLAADDPVVIGDVTMPEVQSSAAYEEIKKKLGKWQGKMTQSLTGEVFDVSYEWKLTSGGNTMTETIIEDGVEMLTTYSDEDGELVVKHYCALGTEPVFSVTQASDGVLAISLDESRSNLSHDRHDFVDSMKWTVDPDDSNSMTFENVVNLDGELTTNRAELRKI